MRRLLPRNELALSTLPALALAVSCIASPARASPEPARAEQSRAEQSRAEQSRETAASSDELILLAGVSGTRVSQATADSAAYRLAGYSVLVGQRHGRWLTSELRGDLLWDESALSGSVQAALTYDPGGRLTPVVGAWMGYRGTTVESALLDGGVAETSAHDGLLGLELGGRLRYGPLMGELMVQGATAALSARETRGPEPGRVGGSAGAEPVQFGALAELSFAARVGLSF